MLAFNEVLGDEKVVLDTETDEFLLALRLKHVPINFNATFVEVSCHVWIRTPKNSDLLLRELFIKNTELMDGSSTIFFLCWCFMLSASARLSLARWFHILGKDIELRADHFLQTVMAVE